MQKSKTKRYYGMTVSQIGILVGTAALLMCVAGAAFFFVLRSPSLAQPPVAATSIIPQASSTPKGQNAATGVTLTPTATMGVAATSVPPDGWVEFQTPGATLWLPSKFTGGDLAVKRDDTLGKITSLGRYYRSSVSGIKSADRETVLWMVDKTLIKQIDIIPTVNARHIILTEDMSLDDYIKSYWAGNIQDIPVTTLYTINETKKLTLLGREAKRVTYSFTGAGNGAIGLTYYVKDGAEIWAINYILDPEDYVNMLAMVEQSIKTFSLVK